MVVPLSSRWAGIRAPSRYMACSGETRRSRRGRPPPSAPARISTGSSSRAAGEKAPGVGPAADPTDGLGRARQGDDAVADRERLHRDLALVGQDAGAAAIAGDLVAAVGDLENRAVIAWTILAGGAEQVAACVGDQAADRGGSVGPVKADEHRRLARVTTHRFGEFEHCAEIVFPTHGRGAEQIARGIGDEARRGVCSISRVEACQHGRHARINAIRRFDDLIHRTIIAGALVRGTEQVAIGVRDQAAFGIDPVAAVEAGEHDRRARIAGCGLGDLEHCAVVVRPTREGCSKQVTARVGRQCACGERSIRAIEADGGKDRTAKAGHDLEDGAKTAGPSKFRGTEQVPSGPASRLPRGNIPSVPLRLASTVGVVA